MTAKAAADGGDDDKGDVDPFAKAKAGGAEAKGRLFNAYRDYLRLVARSELSADLAAKMSASDLVQETFLGAHRDFDHFQGHTDAELRAWLRGILINHLGRARRHYRSTGKRSVGRETSLDRPGLGPGWNEIPDDTATPATRAAQREDVKSVIFALQRLPEPQRLVVIWHQCHGETFEAIGRRLNRSEEAARKLWARALIRLTSELGPSHDSRL